MNINIYSDHIYSPTESSWGNIIHLVGNRLKQRYPDVNFKFILWHSAQMKSFNPLTDEYFDKFKHEPQTDMTMIIENDLTKKYIVVNYWDKGLPQVTTWHDYEDKCVNILTTNGAHTDDISYEVKDNPKIIGTSLIGCNIADEEIINELYLNAHDRIVPDKLWFSSLVPYLFRTHVLDDDRFDAHGGLSFPLKDFFRKLSQYKINMDINCVAEVSCRSAQILGLGQVLIRPKIRHKLKNELIDMVHYAEVKIDDISDYKLLADAYIDTFHNVKKDEELIQFISANARKYYEENCTIESHVNIVLNSINLSKLE